MNTDIFANPDIFAILAIAVPLAGGFFTPVMNILGEKIGARRLQDYFALLISFITVSLMALMARAVIFGDQILTYQLVGRVPPWGINLAVDGLSLLAGMIAAGITFLVVIYSVGFMDRESGLGKYYLLLLILSAGMIGVAFTGDIFNLYVFFEIMSISSYGLVAFFRSNKSVEGAFKYVVIGTVGTVAVLLGIAMVYGLTGTLNIADLSVRLNAIRTMANGFPPAMMLALGLFVTGFGIKIGMIPLHAWLPDAYQAAPSSISSILAGGTAVVGVYALLRVTYMLFGALQMSTIFIFLGLISMIVGAFMALVQSDLKRLLAYSGISQMGYILLGVGIGGLGVVGSTLGYRGGLFHMLNNAIYKSLLFLCAGAIVYKVGTSNMEKLGGLGQKMPVTTVTFIIGALAIAGIPPFNGFASKWLIYFASYKVNPIFTVIAVTISALTLAYFLKAISSVFLGQPSEHVEEISGASKSMLFPMVILAALCIIIGILPHLGLKVVDPARAALMNRVEYVKAVLGMGI